MVVDSTLLLTASGDSSTRLWDVRNGKEIAKFPHDTPAGWVHWALGGKRFLVVTKGVMGRKPTISLYNLTDPSNISMYPNVIVFSFVLPQTYFFLYRVY